jgi:hypothetical protein
MGVELVRAGVVQTESQYFPGDPKSLSFSVRVLLSLFFFAQARISFSQIPAEMKRVYNVEAFKPPGCILPWRQPLPFPEPECVRVTSPSTDRRHFRNPGSGVLKSDIAAIDSAHRDVMTVRLTALQGFS